MRMTILPMAHHNSSGLCLVAPGLLKPSGCCGIQLFVLTHIRVPLSARQNVAIADKLAFPVLTLEIRPQDVVVFVAGGVTYEEARAVALFNSANPARE